MSEIADPTTLDLSPKQFEQFSRLVHEHSGITLKPEKKLMLSSRLAKRVRALNLQSFDDYYVVLTTKDPHGHELEQMLNAVTTNKTHFFRESHHFDELRACLGRPSFLGLGGKSVPRLRIWSAACSTGEEPYSILMTVLDSLPGWESMDIRVLASDLDSQVLSVAERGIYRSEQCSDVPPALAKRWFVAGEGEHAGKLRVRRELRERVAFRRLNLMAPSWPIRIRFHAIFCRNALIYFDAPTQSSIVAAFLNYLEPGGYLFLGHSESMAGVRPDLKSLGRTVYRFAGRQPGTES